MIANRSYAYDLEVPELVPEYKPSKKDFKVIKGEQKTKQAVAKKTKAEPKSKLSLILSVVAIFTMLIVVSYRYNLISEKNLELQRLEIKKNNVNSILATTEIDVDRIIDKDTVEAYAKQQLGMQKPEKSQIVYIDSDYETKVESVSETNFIAKGINKLKEIIGIN